MMRITKAGYIFSLIFGFAWSMAFVSSVAWCETPSWVDPFAKQIFTAWKSGEPMPQISAAYPDATQQEAYLVQRAFVKRIMDEDTIGGYKAAGVANAAADHPLVAVMPASGILSSGDKIVVDLKDDPNRHVETEIGYVFSKAITAPPADVDVLRECVKAVVAIVELPGGPVEQKQPGTGNDIIAWNINAKAMIIGAEQRPESIDPDAIEITLTLNGKTVNTAKGSMAAMGQWNTLLKTVNHVLAQGYTLQPGHIITNGALGKILKAEPGNYHANFGALGVVEFMVQ
jgi:2-keto-4-pentenoate hydratase